MSAIKTALFIAFTVVTLTVGYAAFQSNTENRSKAAQDEQQGCKGGTLPLNKMVPKYVEKANGEKKLIYERKVVCVEKKDKKGWDKINEQRRVNEKKQKNK